MEPTNLGMRMDTRNMGKSLPSAYAMAPEGPTWSLQCCHTTSAVWESLDGHRCNIKCLDAEHFCMRQSDWRLSINFVQLRYGPLTLIRSPWMMTSTLSRWNPLPNLLLQKKRARDGTIVSTVANNKDEPGESDVFSAKPDDPCETIEISSSSEEGSEDGHASEEHREHLEEVVLDEAFDSMKETSARPPDPAIWAWFPTTENLPKHWPLARLTINLEGLVSSIEKLQVAAAMDAHAIQPRPPD